MSINRISGLDGIRSLALVCVLFSHSATTPLTPWSFLHDSLPSLGKFGVILFFALSGYLQTELLLRDEQKHGSISVKAFYIKRLLRVAPVFLVYLLFAMIWALMTNYSMSLLDVASVLFCFKHIIGGAPILIHFWSLSLEVLFYLVWPLLLSRFPRARSGGFLLVLVVSLPMLGSLIKLVYPDTDVFYPSQFCRAEAIFFGCWISVFRRGDSAPALQQFLRKYSDVIFVASLILAFGGMHLDASAGSLAQMELWYFLRLCAGVLLISAAMDCRSRALFWILNNRLCVRLAAISFGVYVWQQFFFFGNPNDWVNAWIPRAWLMHSFWFPLNIVNSLVFGALSYCLIELPLHPWRERMAARAREVG